VKQKGLLLWDSKARWYGLRWETSGKTMMDFKMMSMLYTEREIHTFLRTEATISPALCKLKSNRTRCVPVVSVTLEEWSRSIAWTKEFKIQPGQHSEALVKKVIIDSVAYLKNSKNTKVTFNINFSHQGVYQISVGYSFLSIHKKGIYAWMFNYYFRSCNMYVEILIYSYIIH
jgi:hypothetical protein